MSMAPESSKSVLFDQYTSAVERDGYVVMREVYGAASVAESLDRLRTLATKQEAAEKIDLPSLAVDSPIVWNLHMKDAYFVNLLFESELLQQVVRYFLNDEWYKALPPESPNYILRAMVARSSDNELKMHIDSMLPYQGRHLFALQCMLILEDIDNEKGPTLVVPGSHQSGEYAAQDSLSDAIPVTAKAGDVLLLDSRCWHGAGANQSSGTRWTINASLARWWLKQAFDYVHAMPDEVFRELSSEAKVIAGFCSIPNRDEFEGIDYRKGFDALKDGARPGRRNGD